MRIKLRRDYKIVTKQVFNIVVHEMIHLLERHHNNRFLLLMEKFMPQWKFYKDELNRLPVSHGEWEY